MVFKRARRFPMRRRRRLPRRRVTGKAMTAGRVKRIIDAELKFVDLDLGPLPGFNPITNTLIDQFTL